MPFIGAVVYPGFIIPGRRMRRNSYKAAYKLATNGEGSIEGFVSRMGSVKQINSRKFYKKLFDSFGWDYDWTPEKPSKPQKSKKSTKPNKL